MEYHFDRVDRGIQVRYALNFSTFPNYFSKNWLFEKCINKRMNCEEIAKIESCGRTTILKYLKLHNIETRKTARKYKAGCGLAYGGKVRHNRHMRHKEEDLNIQRMKKLRKQGDSYRGIAKESSNPFF